MFSDVLDEITQYSTIFFVKRKNIDGKLKIIMIEDKLKDSANISISTDCTGDMPHLSKIKSKVIPLLVDANWAINFIYKVTGITLDQAQKINEINTTTKVKDRIKAIKDLGGSINYADMNHQGFKRNLIMVDSSMPQIIGNMLLYYYQEEIKECDKLVKLAGQRDPLGYGDAMMYEYKFKKFLCSCALGMKPAKKWDGLDEANGGYIIVKADGEILAYHIYNRNFFEQYLLDNTILERASTSRHEYMRLYENNGEMLIELNLQLRFK